MHVLVGYMDVWIMVDWVDGLSNGWIIMSPRFMDDCIDVDWILG